MRIDKRDNYNFINFIYFYLELQDKKTLDKFTVIQVIQTFNKIKIAFYIE